jgi:hypothetical protein
LAFLYCRSSISSTLRRANKHSSHTPAKHIKIFLQINYEANFPLTLTFILAG